MSGVISYTNLTTSTAAQALTPPVGGSTKCLISIEGVAATAAVRMRSDGTAPTSTVGHYLAPGKDFVLDFVSTSTKFINDTAASTNCVIHVHWLSD